jgi:putative ABC transport system ATP-binding protein
VAAVRMIGVGHIYEVDPPVVALDGLDLTVADGEYVAVVGPSGCGKSTLLQLAGLLDRATSGTVEVLGVDVSGLADRDASRFRAERIAFIFQAFHLIPGRTLLDNVTLPLKYSYRIPPGERRARGIDCLERVGLGDRAHSRPVQLSGGEQQRVAIARALAPGPSLLLCDEPTGNLDEATTHRVLDVIDKIREHKDLTVLVATHDPMVSDRADRVVPLARRSDHG